MKQNDDFLTQAADHTYSALKRWREEPENDKLRESLLLCCAHYLNAGCRIHLMPNAVVVKRATGLGLGTPSNGGTPSV